MHHMPVHGRGQRGFALIELMVMALVIGVLASIAIPTFLSARERRQDATARSSLRTALSTANVLFTDTRSYGTADISALGRSEPSLAFTDAATASDGPRRVSVHHDADSLALAAKSESGTCFLLRSDRSGQVRYGSTDGACTGDAARSSERAAW